MAFGEGCLWPRANKNEHLGIGESIVPTGNWSPEQEKALVAKLDRRLITICWLMMFIGFLDRQNTSAAPNLNIGKESNIRAALGLGDSNQWNVVIMFYGIGLFLFEPVSNILMKRLSAPVWFCRIMVSWGIVTMCISQTKNFAGIAVARFFLGVAESGLLPGVPYYLSYWYKQGERGVRMSVTYSGLGVAGMVGNFIAIGMQSLEGVGGMYAWQWLFIIEGIPAILMGIVVLFALPPSPQNHKGFLTPEEEIIALQRLPPNAPSSNDKMVWDEARRELSDPVFWLFGFGMMFMVLPVAGVSALLGLIVQGMGFTDLYTVNGFGAAVNGWSALFTIAYGWHSDWTQERYWHIILTIAVGAVVGALPLAITATSPGLVAPVVRFVFLMLASVIPAAYPLTWAYRANTSKGTSAATVNSALTITMYAGGLVAGPWFFPVSTAPNYVPGWWAALACYTLGCICIGFIPIVLRQQLRKAPVKSLINESVLKMEEKEAM